MYVVCIGDGWGVDLPANWCHQNLISLEWVKQWYKNMRLRLPLLVQKWTITILNNDQWPMKDKEDNKQNGLSQAASLTEICWSWYVSCSLAICLPGLTSRCHPLIIFSSLGCLATPHFLAQSKSNILFPQTPGCFGNADPLVRIIIAFLMHYPQSLDSFTGLSTLHCKW